MPKIIDYPRGSLKNSLELASAIDGMGGSCSIEIAAESTGKAVSGAFRALVGAAGRYGLVESAKGKLSTTELYKEYSLAYSDEEERRYLRQAFLNPPLFSAIYERFLGKELPVGHFEKLLVREFGVPANMGSRVVKYFMDAGKLCGVIGQDNVIVATDLPDSAGEEGEDETPSDLTIEKPTGGSKSQSLAQRVKVRGELLTSDEESAYSIRIQGPGMDSTMVIHEEDDLYIVEAMLKKVRSKLKKAEVSPPPSIDELDGNDYDDELAT